MKVLLIIFMTLFTSFMGWGYKDDINSIFLFLAVYFLVVYWALGYDWTSSRKVTNISFIINARKGLLLAAYILLNYVVLHRAYIFGGGDIFFGIAWFSLTSLLLVSKWKQLTKKHSRHSHSIG